MFGQVLFPLVSDAVYTLLALHRHARAATIHMRPVYVARLDDFAEPSSEGEELPSPPQQICSRNMQHTHVYGR